MLDPIHLASLPDCLHLARMLGAPHMPPDQGAALYALTHGWLTADRFLAVLHHLHPLSFNEHLRRLQGATYACVGIVT